MENKIVGKTFVEKVFGAPRGRIVFEKPDIVLTHDNTASIFKTFEKMGGRHVADPDQLLIVLDHNAPPTDAKLATQYKLIRDIVEKMGVRMFHDVGDGICHQIMSYYARPGMIIAGSDSHTCTAGAFNAMAVGIDRTEAAGLWKRGETWFRVPETLKVNLHNRLRDYVYAKDLSLWIIGMISSSGANYKSIEFHGDGVNTLSISDRMTIANLASEMGAKNAVFPPDQVLADFLGSKMNEGIWADGDAEYSKVIDIDLEEIFPLVAVPHQVDNVKSVYEVTGKKLNQALIGTCTNGRLEDLRIAAEILKGKKIPRGLQLLIVPASKEIYMQAIEEGIISKLISAGACILTASCGPCLGTGQGIPADGDIVISTANRNFLGRMGNEKAEIYLASPATVAFSAIKGEISDPRATHDKEKFPFATKQTTTNKIARGDNRRINNVWNYKDIDNLNTDQMFAGNLTYQILSSDAKAIIPHLLAGFDESFNKNVQRGDVIFAGENFGCGSSREHPAVGLAFIGVKAIIVRSVNRIFYRSAVNQGLPIIILPKAVDTYQPRDNVTVDFENGLLKVGEILINFGSLPRQLVDIFKAKGLINYLKNH